MVPNIRMPKKKPARSNTWRCFDHAGLLSNGPPGGNARAALRFVIRRLRSFIVLRSAAASSAQAVILPLQLDKTSVDYDAAAISSAGGDGRRRARLIKEDCIVW